MALALKPELHHYTHDEYFVLEDQADNKSEYYKGQIFAMSGGSINHNRISSNINALLNVGLEETRCEAFTSNLRIFIKTHDLFTYPDISVLCGEPEFYHNRTDTITNPIVIFEVLSPSTRDYDRGQKFEFYRSIPTLCDYVIIHQEKVAIEHHHKVGLNRWLLTEYTNLDENLVIESIDFALPIRRIYARVSELIDAAA